MNTENDNEEKTSYVVLPEKMDFRKIGKIMTKAGYDMNHATARNQVVSAIKELLYNLVKNLKTDMTLEQVNDLVANQEIQQALQEMLYLAYVQLANEQKNVHKEISINTQG